MQTPSSRRQGVVIGWLTFHFHMLKDTHTGSDQELSHKRECQYDWEILISLFIHGSSVMSRWLEDSRREKGSPASISRGIKAVQSFSRYAKSISIGNRLILNRRGLQRSVQSLAQKPKQET